MNPADLAARLAQARTEARVVDVDSDLIGGVEDAYRVQ